MKHYAQAVVADGDPLQVLFDQRAVRLIGGFATPRWARAGTGGQVSCLFWFEVGCLQELCGSGIIVRYKLGEELR
jgi:hypothetical protein